MIYSYPNIQNNTIAIGTVVVHKKESVIEYIKSSVLYDVPFLIVDNIPDPKDELFFEAWEVNFSDPDGYGIAVIGKPEILMDTNSDRFNNDIIQNNITKKKNRNITINMQKSRLIWKNKLRSDRKPLLEILDVQYMRALERGETELIQKIVKKKEFLRDITDDPRFDNASNTDDLREIVIPLNFIEE